MRFNMQHKRSPLLIGALVAVTGAVTSGGALTTPAQAVPVKGLVGREPWPSKRVVLVLPLQLGESWNADRNAGTMLLPQAQDRLYEALTATGKFSVIEAHRFNPILNRAVNDKKVTPDQFDALVQSPSLETAREVLSTMTFTQQPVIADFRLEEVRASGADKRQVLQVQVSGRLYEVTNPVAYKAIVVTSNPVARGKFSALDTAVAAATNAFKQIAVQFVAPLPDFEFSAVEAPPSETPPPAETAPPTPVAPPTPAPAAKPPSSLPEGGFAGASDGGMPFPLPVVPAPAP